MHRKNWIPHLGMALIICNGFAASNEPRLRTFKPKKVQSYQDESPKNTQPHQLMGQLDETAIHFNNLKQRFSQAQQYQEQINSGLFGQIGELNEQLNQLRSLSKKTTRSTPIETTQFPSGGSQSSPSYGDESQSNPSYGGGYQSSPSYGDESQSSPSYRGGSQSSPSYGGESQKNDRREDKDRSQKNDHQKREDQSQKNDRQKNGDRSQKNKLRENLLREHLGIQLFTQINTFSNEVDNFETTFTQAQQQQAKINRQLFGQIGELNSRLNSKSFPKARKTVETGTELSDIQTVQSHGQTPSNLQVQNSDTSSDPSTQITRLTDRVNTIGDQFSHGQHQQAQVNQQLFAEVNNLTQRIGNY